MIDATKAAILADLERYAPIPQPVGENDLTIEDVMAARDMTRNSAIHWLEVLVKAGQLVKSKAISPETGKRVNVYRKVEA